MSDKYPIARCWIVQLNTSRDCPQLYSPAVRYMAVAPNGYCYVELHQPQRLSHVKKLFATSYHSAIPKPITMDREEARGYFEPIYETGVMSWLEGGQGTRNDLINKSATITHKNTFEQ